MLLDKQERKVVDLLADVYNEFVKLPKLHFDEHDEFKLAVHQAQVIIMARPVQKEFNKEGDK